MNAYELADDIKQGNMQNLGNVATMLRQQADRIGVLEANHKIQVNINEKALQYIAELENESTFWKDLYKDLCNVIDEYKKLTPQTKPLSNDEILEMTIWNKNLYEIYVEMDKEDMIAFARAIEERHGIK